MNLPRKPVQQEGVFDCVVLAQHWVLVVVLSLNHVVDVSEKFVQLGDRHNAEVLMDQEELILVEFVTFVQTLNDRVCA